MGFLILPLFLVATVVSGASAATITSPIYGVNALVPDNDAIGLTDYQSISAPGLTEIQSVSVTLTVTGGWNGDLYAHLVHGSGFSVLLNRPGRILGNPDGVASSGLFVTFTDAAALDVHTGLLGVGLATGVFQPDARTEDPLLVTDTSPRSAFLSSFTGLDPNGTWALFVADQSPGEVSTLESWSLSIDAVPEPSVAALGGVALAAMLMRRTRNETPGGRRR